MSYMHWFIIVLALAVVAVLGVLFGVTWIESYQARHLATKEPYVPATSDRKTTAVVYFSRSGNTALAARHLANRLNARLFPLDAPDYKLGLGGLAHALKDANALNKTSEALPDIVPRTPRPYAVRNRLARFAGVAVQPRAADLGIRRE